MKNRSITWILLAFLAPIILFTSCKKEDEFDDERIAEIAGFWTATSATFNGVDEFVVFFLDMVR